MEAIVSSDKRVIDGHSDVNQLMPFKYNWAWRYFLDAQKNHWTPLDIAMGDDIADYPSLKPDEKHIYDNVMATLSTMDIMAMRNIGLAVMEKVTAPEIQIYMGRQIDEECIHTWAYSHCIETLGMPQFEIYNRYRVIPEIRQKMEMAKSMLDPICDTSLDTNKQDDLNQFLLSYMFFAGVFEGMWFYGGFTPIFALQRMGKMRKTAEQLQYIMRDEAMHVAFGVRTIRAIMEEKKYRPPEAQVHEMFIKSYQSEAIYADYILQNPILGYNANMHKAQMRYLGNRRLKQLGYSTIGETPNPVPWLDEQVNIKKEKNFFETKVTEYQSGSALEWEE
jgi:ribonucleoside-diphosphate reductase beta chain